MKGTGPMQQAKASLLGMHRVDSPITSVHAAEKVSRRKWTLRQRVEAFAVRVPYGFIDEELGLLDPDAPESSLRKRRTELADENIIIDSGEKRRNSKGQDCIVWLHSSHVHNPPPIRPKQAKPSKLVALQEENARLRHEVTIQKDNVRVLSEFAEGERAAVVAYLRKQGGGDPGLSPFAHLYASRIESGEHRQ